MTSFTRIRFGALAATAAIVAGGFFAAAPANAAQTGTITVSPEYFDYTAGDWGDGFSVSGTGFTAGTTVTIDLVGPSGSLETYEVPTPATDPDGAFSAVFLPTVAFPAPGDTVSLTATSTDGDTSNTVAIAQWIAPSGIETNVTTLTTAELTVENAIQILACGYAPGSDVTAEAVYDGSTYSAGSYTAALNGCVAFSLWLAGGTAVPGDFTVTVSGTDSDGNAVVHTKTVTVTGEATTTGGGTPTVGNAATSTASTQATRLPVVSG
ncbi:hypothetical protein DOE76_02800 [Leifsonia sp. ku-ls]|nr:hypothetical protein DOE76_02800 [Leifsonia sp. ku-ls]